MGLFDSKNFNSEVFGKYVSTVSDLKRNELIKSGAVVEDSGLARLFIEQTGGSYVTLPMKAPISGTALNYDGSTNITGQARKTYKVGAIVVGRAQGWTERDFSSSIAGGTNFLPVAQEVAHYFDNVDQDTLLAILKGIFAMTGTANLKFVNGHTTDISAATSDNKMTATTLNTTIQKACGDNKGSFSLVIMHSAVATNLENLQLLEYLKYTDKDGVQRDLGLATLNGKAVLIDDSMPVETVGSDSSAYTKYTTYVLGKGAFTYCNCDVEVPYEMDRDPSTNGGQTTLYARQRKLFMPAFISSTLTTVVSPTDTQLSTGTSWELANDGASSKNYVSDKLIPIARIVTRG